LQRVWLREKTSTKEELVTGECIALMLLGEYAAA
jgi:hypothetical protein